MTIKTKTIDEISRSLLQLVLLFRSGKWARDFNWWNTGPVFDHSFGYAEGEKLLQSVVEGIVRLNGTMLSEEYIRRQLTWEFLVRHTIDQPNYLEDPSLLVEARRLVNALVDFSIWQDVDIPIANLLVGPTPIPFLDVTFTEQNRTEVDEWKKGLNVLWHEGASRANAVARVRAPGDQATAVRYARERTDTAIEVLSGLCLPFDDKSFLPVAVVGDFIPSRSTPVRVGSRFSLFLGPPATLLDLQKDVLSKLENKDWDLIHRIYQKPDHSDMERKCRDCVHWLAEATRPDKGNAKYLKIAVALETLIGSESKDSPITDMLAERSAFVAGKDLDHRRKIDGEVRTYYRKRGSIVHTGKGKVTQADIDGFGTLVRRLAIALAKMLDEIGDQVSDVKKFQTWVTTKRYTLPEDR